MYLYILKPKLYGNVWIKFYIDVLGSLLKVRISISKVLFFLIKSTDFHSSKACIIFVSKALYLPLIYLYTIPLPIASH